MIAFMQVTAEGDSAAFNPSVGVDVPETGQTHASRKIGRSKPVFLFASTFASVQARRTCKQALRARKPRCTLANIARCNGLKSEGF